MANVDTACKETWVNYFQCKQAAKLTNFVNSLSYGICPEKNVRENNVLSSLIDVLYRYEVFEDQVTYAQSITVSIADETIPTDISINVGGNNIMYISAFTGTAEELAQEISTQFLAYNIVDFYTEVVGASLYVYSYNTNYDDTTLTEIVYTDPVTIENNDIRDNLDLILDLWNCMTFEQFCNIVCYAKKYTNIKCNCSGQ
jgi:hypothetical protein